MELKLDYSQVRFQEKRQTETSDYSGHRPEIIRLAAVINKCRSYLTVFWPTPATNTTIT